MVGRENEVGLDVEPRFLLCPPELRRTARKLAREERISDGRDLRVLVEHRLSNGATDPTDDTVRAGSASTWFLMAGGQPTIEIGFLFSPKPHIRSFTLDKGQWGMGWDVKMDIGAKALAFEAMRKATA